MEKKEALLKQMDDLQRRIKALEKPIVYGYARVSTRGQAAEGNSLEAQILVLTEHGCEKIFKDVYTGKTTDRPNLGVLIDVLKSGDTIMVTKLDRLARSASEGSKLISELLERGVSVHVLNMGLIDGSPTGKLISTVLLAFAEFERDMIIERTREGKEVARQNPNFRDGRPKKFNPEQIEHALELCKSNSVRQVSRMTGISTATINRAKAKAKAERMEE